MTTKLIKFDTARKALAEARSIDEVKKIRDQAEALRVYAKQASEGLEMQNWCADIKLRAERKAGKMLKETERAQGKRTDLVTSRNHVNSKVTLDDLGVSKIQSHRWQKVAAVPENIFEEHISSTIESQKELTTASVLSLSNPRPAYNTGENEWYTPPEYIEAAHTVLGTIDLDPASSAKAQKIIQAKKFYTTKDDGLSKKWRGRVWMNPPYGAQLVGQFIDKLCSHYDDGDISEAIILVNNSTETAWFQNIGERSAAVCFPAGRIKFLDKEGYPGSPLQGQAILYLGDNSEGFYGAFQTFGIVWQ